ncbi:TetR family transcriptional regulator [Nostoc flagelliforme FACHB-838]|uniref:TetR family transcriptional regulator n=1 Tax=Nostoc flagelliforme FACHB-838 TaxID=2692904 RepID=A0ABR8DYJ9_9NOSO|nr:TetR/AcrR family transcriptional regulator [Nostoc flagelliforme]MBD2534334.1 TetR family transcriptional regulator [Nostoc flagelliforme FACHB-838]
MYYTDWTVNNAVPRLTDPMAPSKSPKSRSLTRKTLLCAATQVILEKGVEALTLDAVARQAGVSKGGLLYHFPNKNALVVGLGEQLIQEFEAALQAEFDQDDAPGTPGQWVRAYIRSTLRMSGQTLALVARLTSLIVEMPPELLNFAKAYEQRCRQRLEADGLDPTQAVIIQLAIDGLWFSEVFQLSALDETRRTQVVERLLAMTRSPE